jgi:hypothetical protein
MDVKPRGQLLQFASMIDEQTSRRAGRVAAVAILACMSASMLCGCRSNPPPVAASPNTSSQTLTRTELFLGLSKPGGGTVSQDEFKAFLDAEVTPRFPDGYSVIAAEGRWRDAASGITLVEPSRIIMILHEPTSENEQKIETIREAYKKRFNQDAVLRTQYPQRASF